MSSASHSKPEWFESIYYAESLLPCSIAEAWPLLLDYPAWNPTFVGAHVEPFAGQANEEGEIVRIRKSLNDVKGDPLPTFFAKTVKLRPKQNVVWYVYPETGEGFRNFVDFGLEETPRGPTFKISYYAYELHPPELIAKQRQDSASVFQKTADAFASYCAEKTH